MASGPGSRAEEQPPMLPVKLHRSHSHRHFSESDCVMLSPVELQHQNYACNEVFPEPTDCHAAQCPIHQRYDASRHQMRFFSDGTPPPIPKKKLARTFSLPSTDVPTFAPLSPLQRQPQNFDNPLYILAPISDTSFQEEMEEFEPVRGSPVPLLSFSQLSFDTPDEHLAYLFSSFDDQRVVFQGIQHRHLLFLRSMAQSVEAGILLASERDISSYQPEDFLLCEGSKPNQIGEAVYYSLHSPKFPGRVLGLRVHKQTHEASSAQTKHQPSHVNVQAVTAHFQPISNPRNDFITWQSQDPSCPFKPGCTDGKPPDGGSTEYATGCMNTQCFLMRGHSVSVERDLPHATLEDFVQESTACLDYDRQVCVLLLQILTGLQHLHISASAAKLKPCEIFLVWPNREGEDRGNKLEQDETKTSRLKEEMELTGGKGKIQMLWRTHGSPRVLLTPLSSALSVPNPSIYIKSQIGALIQYFLSSQETSLSKSLHRRGLLYLASLLQSEGSGPQMADMVAMLQVLLWGPRVPLFDHKHPMITAVHNWLTIKRLCW
ncbi:Pseudopodium-enriched atypical kinase 1 [Larimichthys crocea]|uniref:Pseudopodium-enriched atypical kinase 1 n=1 Tax=Larimichthys crocea TaxID=215358 RepID=A0A6G0ISR0_LARCR|nr:Pseudopodium-enriched atypical kinase 1 [Larimichthys crocea]